MPPPTASTACAVAAAVLLTYCCCTASASTAAAAPTFVEGPSLYEMSEFLEPLGRLLPFDSAADVPWFQPFQPAAVDEGESDKAPGKIPDLGRYSGRSRQVRLSCNFRLFSSRQTFSRHYAVLTLTTSTCTLATIQLHEKNVLNYTHTHTYKYIGFSNSID